MSASAWAWSLFSSRQIHGPSAHGAGSSGAPGARNCAAIIVHVPSCVSSACRPTLFAPPAVHTVSVASPVV